MSFFNNDFSQYAAGAAPTDWTRRWVASPGGWTIVAAAAKDGVKNALQSTGLTAVRNAYSWDALDNAPGRETVNILARVKSTIASNQDFQFLTRGSGSAGTETGYRGGVANNTRRTDRYDNGVAYTWTNTSAGPTLAAETWYLIRYSINGGTIEISLWLDDGIATEPSTPNFTLVDPTPNIVPGWIGIFQGVVNGKTTFDEIAFATAGDIATFDPPTNLVITDPLTLTDPGSSFNVVHAVTITDALGLKDPIVPGLVSSFNINITDGLNIQDTEAVSGQFVTALTVIDSIDLNDDVLQQNLIPSSNTDPDLYSIDFNSDTVGIPPINWTARYGVGSVWNVRAGLGKNGRNALEFSTATAGRYGLSYNPLDSFNTQNIEILARLQSNSAINQADLRTFARASGPTNSELITVIGNVNITNRIAKIKNSVFTTIKEITPISITPNVWYLLRARYNEANLYLKLWLDDGSPEPDWALTVVDNDAAVIQNGWAGLTVSVITGITLYDQIAFAINGKTAVFNIPSLETIISVRGIGIIQELIEAGYTVDTIMDRERLRLLSKTGVDPIGKSLQDLYYLAGERPRL